jgi:hypothetical protein
MLRRALLAALVLPATGALTAALAQPWWDERREEERWRQLEAERRREAERRHVRWEEERARQEWLAEERHREEEAWYHEHRR